MSQDRKMFHKDSLSGSRRVELVLLVRGSIKMFQRSQWMGFLNESSGREKQIPVHYRSYKTINQIVITRDTVRSVIGS